MITGVDRVFFFIKYNTGALSTGAIRGENIAFCSTILICGLFSAGVISDDDDSSSLTNEKDHHYFLNSADVCW